MHSQPRSPETAERDDERTVIVEAGRGRSIRQVCETAAGPQLSTRLGIECGNAAGKVAYHFVAIARARDYRRRPRPEEIGAHRAIIPLGKFARFVDVLGGQTRRQLDFPFRLAAGGIHRHEERRITRSEVEDYQAAMEDGGRAITPDVILLTKVAPPQLF